MGFSNFITHLISSRLILTSGYIIEIIPIVFFEIKISLNKNRDNLYYQV